MRVFVGVILFVSLTFQAFSKDASVRTSDILSAVSGYQDSVYYRAVLVQGAEDADLYIFTKPSDKLLQAVYAPDIAVTGIGGIDAYLRKTPNGTLQLISQNIALGRHRWEQALTIVYRDNQFLVGGYTYSDYDALDVDSDGNIKTRDCDFNFLTGRGVKDEQPIRTSMTAIPVQNWTVDTYPPECFFD